MVGSRLKDKALKRRVIVKRIRRVIPARPQGAWKIAYADFVTALMAFFLLMWLISAVKLEDRQAIAKYFSTPLLVVLAGGKSDDVSTDIIQGVNGNDITKTAWQVRAGPQLTEQITISEAEARRLLHRQEVERLQLLKRELEQLINANQKLSQFKNQLRIDMTTEGLRIQIIDDQNRPMFEIGSSVLQPYTVAILREIGKTLNQVPNKIGLSGHTDATPYQGNNYDYSNWELSADRSNSSRRELITGGMKASQILRVVGLASSVLFNPANPYDPNNRRISIIVMNKMAEEAVTKEPVM